MIVEIDPALFAPGAATVDSLIELLRHVHENRHQIELDDAPEVARWFSGRDASWRDEWEQAQDLVVRESAQEVLRVRVRVVPGPDDVFGRPTHRLSLATARRVLAAPLKILVENARTDGGLFLLRVAELGQRVERLKRYIDDQWIEFEGSGGNTEMLEIIKANRADARWRLRRYVVFDGDSLRPKAPSDTAQKLSRRCETLRGCGTGVRP